MFDKTIQMIEDYPYELIIFRKQLLSPNELINKINQIKTNANPQELHLFVASELKKTSGWTWEPNKKSINYDEVMEEMING